MKVLFSLILSGTCLLLFVSSCKKQDTSKEALDPQVQQHNSDAGSYKSELDQADNDINNTFSNTSLGKAGGGSSPLCGVKIDTSKVPQKIIPFIFAGEIPCSSPSRTRPGKIKVHLPEEKRGGEMALCLPKLL